MHSNYDLSGQSEIIAFSSIDKYLNDVSIDILIDISKSGTIIYMAKLFCSGNYIMLDTPEWYPSIEELFTKYTTESGGEA